MLEPTGLRITLAGVTVADFREGKIRSVPDVFRRPLADRADLPSLKQSFEVEFLVENHPNPLDIEFLEIQIRREASAAMGLGDEVDLAIFVREAGEVIAGISGWTWGDCCELQSLWVEPSRRGHGLATSAPSCGRSGSGGTWLHADGAFHLQFSGSRIV